MDKFAGAVEDLIYRMEHWGYYLASRSHPHSPGYSGLLVAIRDKPTGKHFDPESIHLQLFNHSDALEQVTLTLRRSLSGSRHVCPGSVVLRDRLSKEEEFFTFGATLESEAVGGETVYALRSPAPILWLTPSGLNISDQLAAEFGRLIAELRAGAGANDDKYYRQLEKVDPLTLYATAIHSILMDYDKTPSLRECYSALYATLREEKKWLEETDHWSNGPSTLEQLLCPNGDRERGQGEHQNRGVTMIR